MPADNTGVLGNLFLNFSSFMMFISDKRSLLTIARGRGWGWGCKAALRVSDLNRTHLLVDLSLLLSGFVRRVT